MNTDFSAIWSEIGSYNKNNIKNNIEKIEINREEKYINITATCDEVNLDFLTYTKQFIINRYSDFNISFFFHFPKEAFNKDGFLVIVDELKKLGKPINGIIDSAIVEINDEKITITLKNGGKFILEEINFANEFNTVALKLFNTQFEIELVMDEESFTKEAAVAEVESSPVPILKKSSKRNVKQLKGETVYLNLEDNNGEVILGKEISLSKLQPLREVIFETGGYTVWGEVFSVHEFENRRKIKTITVSITDYTGSIDVKSFSDEAAKALSLLKVGDAVLVEGRIDHDQYSNDYIMNPSSVTKINLLKRKDESDLKRVELHLHTNMSRMDAIPSARDAVNLAYQFGHRAIAITDHGVVQSFPEAANTISAIKKKNPEADFKVIYGVEAYYIDNSKNEFKATSEDNTRPYHMIILVKNMVGLKNLYELISVSHIKNFYRRPIMLLSDIQKYKEGLVFGSACEQGEVFKAIVEKRDHTELLRIAEKYDYLEIQPLKNNSFMIRNHTVGNIDGLIDFNKKVIALGKELNKPVVATCDVHFLNERDSIFREILLQGQGFEDSDVQAPLIFRTTEEMLKEFEYLDEETRNEVVVTNTNLIADMIDSDIIPIPDGTFTPSIEGAEETLKKLVEESLLNRYGDNPSSLIKQRVDSELSAILKNGFAIMYITAYKLVNKSESDGYHVGSRGSVGSSFIAFLIGISDVNPLPAHYFCKTCHYIEMVEEAESGFDFPNKKCPHCSGDMAGDGHDIPFETFIGFNGEKAPDIDLNFSSEYQTQAHRYTEELFGSDYVFKAGTISAIQDRTAYGFVKKYLEEKGLTVNRAEENRLVSGCTGVKRTTGQHPGGMVVIPSTNDITDFTPIQYPADDKTRGVRTTHFDFDSLKETLLKLDILGHDVPTIYRYLEDITGIMIPDVPMYDPKVYRLFTSIEPLGVNPKDVASTIGTLGIPEMGTQFVEQILVESHPKKFSDLLQISGLAHGTDVWQNNAQLLIKQGICSIGEVIGTRDSIMVYLMRKGVDPLIAFNIMEFTRRGYAITQFTDELKKLVKSHGVEDWYIDSCIKIKYLFPKAHAAAYVMSAVKISWFKLYYPLAFYATYFTVRGRDIIPEVVTEGVEAVKENLVALKTSIEKKPSQKLEDSYITMQIATEMLCRGYEFLPVELYKSDATQFIIEDGKIRMPYVVLEGIGENASFAIKKAADLGDYISAEELAQQPGISMNIIEILYKYNALGSLPRSSQTSLF